MIKTKSLREPKEPRDGTRVLITRYRPRGVRKGQESWSEWDKRLAPSTELFDAFYGRKRKGGRVVARDLPPLPFGEYVRSFKAEMKGPEAKEALAALRRRSRAGETVTLLCFCEDEARCHRGLVRGLL
ncbi:MAG TPA: DUF488 family protein [Planctomycetota bacterium]|nr:DUF488 family protein [Planctomycetota bacterium]